MKKIILYSLVALALSVVLYGCSNAIGKPVAGSPQQINETEFTLTAQESMLPVNEDTMLPVWTFNNSVPGPEIRVKQGDKLKIKLENKLTVPTTIHWHGLPVPNNMDGIPGVTQNAVQPGATFTYEFTADVPGTYWYHSHQDGVNQVDKGLYGSIIVEAANEQVDRDYVLMLDEWMSSTAVEDGKASDSSMGGMDHSKMNMGNKSDNKSKGDSSSKSMPGMDMDDMSEYDLYTINGKTGSAINKLVIKEGEKVKIRLINAGYKTHQLHLHGHEFTVTATDGQPIVNPTPLKDQLVTIAPGERYDIEFVANNPGEWLLEEHGMDAPVEGMKTVIQYEGSKQSTDVSNAQEMLAALDITTYGSQQPAKFSIDQEYTVEYTMNLGTEKQGDNTVYTINGQTYPDIPPIEVKKGDLVKVEIINNSASDEHPMHLHGHFFQVLSKNGIPVQGSPLIKDTINVKPGESYVIAFEADNPGNWMLHCHELHHAAAGMMTQVNYTGYQPTFVPDPKAGNKAD